MVTEDLDDGFPELLEMDTTTDNRGGAIRWLASELLSFEEREELDYEPPQMKLTT